MSKVTRLTFLDLNKILIIPTILMEIVWSYAWLIWISTWLTLHWDRPPLTLVGCIILGLVVGVLNRFSYARNWPLNRTRWIVLSGSLLLLVIIIRWNLAGGYSLNDTGWFSYATGEVSRIVAAFFFGLYVTWRAISASRPKYYFNDLYRQFVIGLSATIILLIVWDMSGTQLSSIWSSAGSYVIAYFGLGLLALAVLSLEKLRTELVHHQEAASSFQRRWLSMIVTIILLILGVSGAISNIFFGNGIQKIVHFLGVAGNWLATGLAYLLLPLGFLAEILIYVGLWLKSLFNPQTKPKLTIPDLSNLKKAAEGQSPVPIPETLLIVLKWVALALVIGLALYFIARTLMRYWDSKSEEGIDEVHETFWSWSLFRADLRHFLLWLFRWVHWRKRNSSENLESPVPMAVSEGENDRIFNIRELYQAMLWQGRQMGIPRRKSETPYEYQQKLESRADIPREEIDALTEAYIADKYGLVNPTPQKVALLNRIWHNFRQKIMNL